MSVPVTLRPPDIADLPDLSALCLRSKAHWGYDAAFMAACVPVLTIRRADLSAMTWQVADVAERAVGVAAIRCEGETASIDKLFVDPGAMGLGVGSTLMGWALQVASAAGARHVLIESDPQAAPFYARFKARQVGEVASDAIEGCVLPLLEIVL